MSVITRTAIGTINQVAATSHVISSVTIPAGNLAIIRFVASVDNAAVVSSAITDTAGNTWSVALQRQSGTGDTISAGLAYCVLTSSLSAGSVTIPTVSTALGASLTYFNSDVGWLAQASVLDKTVGKHNLTGTPWNSGVTATRTQADELLVGCGTHNNTSGSSSLPTAPWAEETDAAYTNVGPSYRLVEQWQAVTVTGTDQIAGTWSSAELGEAVIATFKTAAAASTTLPPRPTVIDTAVMQAANN